MLPGAARHRGNDPDEVSPTSSISLTGISSAFPMSASGIFVFLRRFRKFT